MLVLKDPKNKINISKRTMTVLQLKSNKCITTQGIIEQTSPANVQVHEN